MEYTENYGKINYSKVPEGIQSFIPKSRWLILSLKETITTNTFPPTIQIFEYYVDNWGGIYNPSIPEMGFSPPSDYFKIYKGSVYEKRELVQLNNFLIDLIKTQYEQIFSTTAFPNIYHGSMIGPRTMNLNEYKYMLIYPICQMALFTINLRDDMIFKEGIEKIVDIESKSVESGTEDIDKIKIENEELKISLEQTQKNLSEILTACEWSQKELKELGIVYDEYKKNSEERLKKARIDFNEYIKTSEEQVDEFIKVQEGLQSKIEELEDKKRDKEKITEEMRICVEREQELIKQRDDLKKINVKFAQRVKESKEEKKELLKTIEILNNENKKLIIILLS